MFGYQIFKKLFFQLDEGARKKILGNIFLLKNVSVYSFLVENNCILFRIYADRKFYQIHFILNFDCEDYPFVISTDFRTFSCIIYVSSLDRCDLLEEAYPFIDFVKILLSNDEKVITELFYHFL